MAENTGTGCNMAFPCCYKNVQSSRSVNLLQNYWVLRQLFYFLFREQLSHVSTACTADGTCARCNVEVRSTATFVTHASQTPHHYTRFTPPVRHLLPSKQKINVSSTPTILFKSHNSRIFPTIYCLTPTTFLNH